MGLCEDEVNPRDVLDSVPVTWECSVNASLLLITTIAMTTTARTWPMSLYHVICIGCILGKGNFP